MNKKSKGLKPAETQEDDSKTGISFWDSPKHSLVKDRGYGFLKAKTSTIDYFQARLANLPPKIPKGIITPNPTPNPSSSEEDIEIKTLEPDVPFEMRRKLFDQGEFTICKGRKLSNDFPSADTAPNYVHHNSFAEAENLKDFCMANKIKI